MEPQMDTDENGRTFNARVHLWMHLSSIVYLRLPFRYPVAVAWS